MNSVLQAINPFAKIETVEAALLAARASSVSLWLSGAKWILAAILMIGNMSEMRAALTADAVARGDASVQTMVNAGGVEITVAVTAAVGLFQILLGGVQWRSPSTVIPIIFLILSTYGLGTTIWGHLNGGGDSSPWSVALSYFTLIVAVVFHAIGLRGATRLERLHKGT